VPGSPYDEAFDQAGGLRRPYAAMAGRAGWDPLRPSPTVAGQLRDRPFGDDARILPIPLVIDDTEYRSIIEAGLTQRAGALQQLFADLVFGPQSVLDAGIGLTPGLLDGILAAEGTSLDSLRRLWQGHDPAEIRFVYGPDLVRDPGGRWVVLEDNIGCVGGSADGSFVADQYRTATGWRCHAGCDRDPDLAVAVRRWLDQLGAGAGEVLAVLGCDSTLGDGPWAPRVRENDRRRAVLDQLGIPLTDGGRLAQRLRHPGAKPPTALVNFDIDTPAAGGTPSPLVQAFSTRGVALFNAPGTGVLGNKALLPFIDEIIRLFTGREPILPAQETRLLTDAVLPTDAHDWVVKTATGCQGTEVFVLSGQPRERLDYVEKLLRGQDSATAMVAQRYVEPSVLSAAGPQGWDAYRVEIRPVSYLLGWQDVYVGRRPVGKAVSAYDARRLNNISQGACYLPVLPEPCCTGTSTSTATSASSNIAPASMR
jgi:Circularly permuted ATP-grasp type 2